jgi:alanyl-tRNA synthetase
MESSEIRQRFLDFFGQREHEILPSDPLLTADPDLLFNIAGMVPFKPYFLGEESPPASRITTAQKCLRTEDIDQVGVTARHLTFFEMLGNFSFGDYFKEDAIRYGWRFLVDEMDLDPDRLWITVFAGDEEQGLEPDKEAESLWKSVDGVRENRILRLGTDENFWAMGATGPCGPCSEILYDQEATDPEPDRVKRLILDGRDRVLELWNLVFMEFQRTEKGGDLEPLPEKNIDTGLGLERLAAIMQGADTNFGTDLFQPLIDTVSQLTPESLDTANNQSRARVIADHARASSFLLAEGLLPGNEGRGYVLRRLIRRAHLRGRRLGLKEPFLEELVGPVIDIMGSHFTELSENQDTIKNQLKNEEEQFENILEQGLDELDDRINSLQNAGSKTISGKEVFDLYETHGLPIEMTKDVLDEAGIVYDESEINQAKREHEERSRNLDDDSGQGEFDFDGIPDTTFTGYDELQRDSEVVAIYTESDLRSVDSVTFSPEADSGQHHHIVLDKTPFYAEGGGQSGDEGWIKQDKIRIDNTVERSGHYIHEIDVHPSSLEDEITLEVGENVPVSVDESFRRGNMRHHTATHLLHHALRRELGDQVMQDGSSLDDESLRFDFTFNEAVDQQKLNEIENQINEWIYREIPIETQLMDRDEAEEKGALAFFGEHYGQEVRVVIMDDPENNDLDSKEFCGGTHLNNTGEIGLFTITNETAVASGVRRIEARAGESALQYLTGKRQELREAARAAGIDQTERLPDRIRDLRSTLNDQEKELDRLRQKQSASKAQELIDKADVIEDVAVLVETFDNEDSDVLKTIIDDVKERIDSGIILLFSKADNNVQLVMGVTEDLTETIHAGDWIRDLGGILGGGGGGRPEFAEAGGSKPEAIGEAIDQFYSKVEESVGETARH